MVGSGRRVRFAATVLTHHRRRIPLVLSVSLGAVALVAASATGATFSSSGAIANGPGNAPDGPGVSVMTSTDSILGFGAQQSANNRVADDFTVSDPAGWTISGFELFSYQTGSTTTSTITGVNLQIWNGPPDATPADTGAVVVFGDTVTNRLDSSTFSGVYRTAAGDTTNTTRPIMRTTVTAATTLPTGTYWLDVQYAGSLGSGPWQPPVVLPGDDPAPGNALQSVAGADWAAMTDAGSATQKAVPFKVLGAPDTAITAATAAGNTAKVTFTGVPAGATTGFECRLDGGAFTACPASGTTYPNLKAGLHTVQVRSRIGSETDATPATSVVTITKPALTLGGKAKQRLGSAVKVKAGCDRVCTTTVSGKLKAVSGSGQKVSVKLKSVTVQVASDGTRTVKVKLGKAAKKAARAALDSGGKVTVKLKGSAKDSAGNLSTKVKRGVTLT